MALKTALSQHVLWKLPATSLVLSPADHPLCLSDISLHMLRLCGSSL